MSRHCRFFVSIVFAAGFLATGAQAEAVRQKARIRAKMPVTAFVHHSGGYAALPRGDVLVGTIVSAAPAPASGSLFGAVGYYDDGRDCVIRDAGVAFFFAPHFERLCRAVD